MDEMHSRKDPALSLGHGIHWGKALVKWSLKLVGVRMTEFSQFGLQDLKILE